MQDSLTLQPNMVFRRQPKKLPSIWQHLFAAATLLIGAWLLLTLAKYAFGDTSDSIASGEIAVAAMPLPPVSDSLNGTSGVLPDLLEGEVAANTNPTETLDALGNKAGGLAGRDAPTTRASIDSQTGSKTILIDGAPVGGTAAAPLPRAPISGLSRMSAYGNVPAPSTDGRKPVKAYARPAGTSGTRKVSVIVGGLGINASVTRRAITELPADVTLSFAAHAQGLQNWINQARARGHEVMIELPMESADFNPAEPGADRALLANGDAAQNIRNLDWLMSRAQGYFAVTNYNGDAFLTRLDAAAPVLSHIKDAGLGFIFDGSASAPSLRAVAGSASLPYAQATTLIDNSTELSAINQELSRVASAAGSAPAIGVGFAYPQTIDAVSAWTRTLRNRGITLVPASAALSPN